MSINSNEIQNFIYQQGGSFVGFSNVQQKLPDNLRKYPYAITFGIRLSDAIVEEIDTQPTFTYFNHYRSINSLIDSISLKLILFLQKHNYNGYSIAASQSIPTAEIPYSGMFQHKTAAVAAGLGWIGRSALFIHKEYGTRVRLGTVLTDLPLCEGNYGDTLDNSLKNICESCGNCVRACPAMAIRGNKWETGVSREALLDAHACSEYMSTHFKNIGRGSVCGICMKVCPQNKSN